jgi:hypothetical protein
MGNEIATPTPTPTPTPSPSLPAVVVDGEGREGLVADLVVRGVRHQNAQSLVADHSADRVATAIAWFDEQQPGSVGGGVLVAAIREGRAPRPRTGSLDREREYGEQICDWLNQHFPELREPSGRPHPAAIAAVIRLHHAYGKGRLTLREHGGAIRAAVRRWGERFSA